LRYLNPTALGKSDPLFGRDIAFYIFQLPLLKSLYQGSMAALGLCAILSALLYIFDGKVAAGENGVAADPQVKPHLFTLLGLILPLKAWGYRLNMYALLYSGRGAAYGAGFTDVHVVLPVLKVLLVVAALSAVFVLLSGYRIVPIEQSLIYVQPLYLKAAQGEIPQLKRVLAACGDQIVMEANLERSLSRLFGEGRAAAPALKAGDRLRKAESREPLSAQQALARRAMQHLQRVRESYRRDDWAGFGEELKKLEETLQQLGNRRDSAGSKSHEP